MAVQTITYEDKSYLNQNADIPATNKVQDTDMNEIKTVVNNNAAELQNVQTKNIITLASNGGGTISATNKIPLNTIIGQVGTKLTANTSTHRIVVGSGITHILITAQAQGYTSDNNNCQIAIYKNGVATMKSYQVKATYATMPISTYVIDVQEGDYFELYVISGTLNVSTGLGNGNLCYITVEAI